MLIDFPAWFSNLLGFDRRKASVPIHPVHDARYRLLVEAIDSSRTLTGALNNVVLHVPPTQWFSLGITHDARLAAGGSPDPSAMASFGAVNVPYACTIDEAHLHLTNDDGHGSLVLELWRFRFTTAPPTDPANWTLLGSVSAAAGSGDFSRHQFTFVSAELKELEAGDYLYAQATSTFTGGAGNDTLGAVDIHFAPIPLRLVEGVWSLLDLGE
jgi:hypothetical protein